LIAVGVEMPDNAKLADTGEWTWLVIAVSGLVAASKDLKTYKADLPPEDWAGLDEASRCIASDRRECWFGQKGQAGSRQG